MNNILLDRLHRLENKNHSKQKRNADKKTTDCSRLKVYYGWAKVNKIRKREAISVIFENENGAGEHHRYSKTLHKLQNTVFVRYQTEDEAKDAAAHIRVFTEYSIFLDDKTINGDLQKALDANEEADKNNVSQEILLEIRNALQKHYESNHTK